MKRFRKYKKVFTQGYVLLKYLYYKMYCHIRKNVQDKYKNLWLIAEREDEARDNGYFFFKYLIEKHPNIEVRYIIRKESVDFDKIKKTNKYIIYGSRDHYLAFINAKLLISTHLSGTSPDVGLFFRLQRYDLLKINGKLICLKHGITKDYLPFLNPKDTNLSLLITAAQKEYNYIINKNGFSPDVVKLTGFARYDNLIKKKSNQILFMPTHRIYMHYMNNNEFIESDYFKYVNGLMNNSDLINILYENNLSFVFYIHSEFYKYIHLFNPESPKIIIADINNYSVQDLLINSSLLITDYSSVFFDFAYMEKPIIYYQFDYEKYRKEHYSDGYFDYDKSGFGLVCHRENDVVKEINKCITNNYIVKNEYLNRINDFFAFKDNNNCQRIYDAIKKLDE